MEHNFEHNCGFTEGNCWFRYRAAAIIVEDGYVLFAGNEKEDYYYSIGGAVHMGETAEDAVKREVFEETGVHYEIDHLAVIHENFFRENRGTLKDMDCHEIAFYYVMKPRGTRELHSDSYTQGVKESMYWLPISELDKQKAFPTFMKEYLQSEHTGIEHIVTDERAKKVSLYTPKLEDLWFREAFLSDPDTMSYNNAWGGTIPFPRESWEGWYDHWVTTKDGRHFYRYLKNADGEFVGEVAYHIMGKRNICMADVIVASKYRGRGYGKEGLFLLCEQAKANGIDCIYDNIAVDNPAIKLFEEEGFLEESRAEGLIFLKKQLRDNG